MTNSEQIQAINNIMNKPTDRKYYAVKGDTYSYREELKSWGWQWDVAARMWTICATPNANAVMAFKEIAGIWVEEL